MTTYILQPIGQDYDQGQICLVCLMGFFYGIRVQLMIKILERLCLYMYDSHPRKTLQSDSIMMVTVVQSYTLFNRSQKLPVSKSIPKGKMSQIRTRPFMIRQSVSLSHPSKCSASKKMRKQFFYLEGYLYIYRQSPVKTPDIKT